MRDEFIKYCNALDRPALIPKLLKCFGRSEMEDDFHVPRAKIEARLKQLDITFGHPPDVIVEEGAQIRRAFSILHSLLSGQLAAAGLARIFPVHFSHAAASHTVHHAAGLLAAAEARPEFANPFEVFQEFVTKNRVRVRSLSAPRKRWGWCW